MNSDSQLGLIGKALVHSSHKYVVSVTVHDWTRMLWTVPLPLFTIYHAPISSSIEKQDDDPQPFLISLSCGPRVMRV